MSTSIMYVSIRDVLKTVLFSILCTFNMHTIFRKKTISKHTSNSEAKHLPSIPIFTTDSFYKTIEIAQEGYRNTV